MDATANQRRRPAACCVPCSDANDAESSTSRSRGRYACRYINGSSRGTADPLSSTMVVQSGHHGYHAMASCDIAAGSVIVQCLPLAHSLLRPTGSTLLDEDDEEESGQRRRVCTRCFFREGDDDASGGGLRRKKFGRCSKCRAAHYCSRSCQADDWAEQHKLECRYLVKRRKQSRTSATPLCACTPEEDAIPLLLRTFCSLKRLRDVADNESESEAIAVDDAPINGANDAMVVCGPDHFASLMVSSECSTANTSGTESTNPATILAQDLMESCAGNAPKALHIWGYNHEQIHTADQAMRRTLDAFRKNNFGIVNSLHAPIGEGVYPCAALLNHSCRPNCILRYKLGVPDKSGDGGRYHPPILQIVACRDILQGEELCHSYVDLALDTPERRARLHDTHGFHCVCARCTDGGCSIDLPRERGAWALYPLAREFRSPRGGTGRSSLPSLTKVGMDEAMAASSGVEVAELTRVLDQSRMRQQRASQCMLEGDADGELQCLQQATELFAFQGSGGDNKWISPFHTQLYSIRCAYLSALLANGLVRQAAEQCEHVVSFLAVAFAHVENHPLLGLQLYTLGDLYTAATSASLTDGKMVEGEELQKKAKLAYSWARRVMIVTHGEDDSMVLTLECNLSS